MSNIVLIGPIGAGKSTVAPLVAESLGRQCVELDEVRWDFYATIGYSNSVAMEILERGGMSELCEYWKPFELHLVEHIVGTCHDTVLDFGAGYSHYDGNEPYSRRAAAALAAHFVVLLMPCEDVVASDRILSERQPEEFRLSVAELNAQFVRSATNRQYADHILYTEGLTPSLVAACIVAAWKATLRSA